jgi:hypothetical protein
VSSLDFAHLRRQIAEAAARVYATVRAANPGESFYAFALCTVDDVSSIIPNLNTEAAFAKAAEVARADTSHRELLDSIGVSFEASLLGDYRWYPFDWTLGAGQDPSFGALNASLQAATQAGDEDDAFDFDTFKAQVLAAMVLGLGDARASGAFGAGAERDAITLFCTIADSADAPWFIEDSARRLNSAATFQVFYDECVTYIADDEDDADAGDEDPGEADDEGDEDSDGVEEKDDSGDADEPADEDEPAGDDASDVRITYLALLDDPE